MYGIKQKKKMFDKAIIIKQDSYFNYTTTKHNRRSYIFFNLDGFCFLFHSVLLEIIAIASIRLLLDNWFVVLH